MDRRPGGSVHTTSTLVGTRNGHGKPASAATGNYERYPQATCNRGPSRGLGATIAALARADERQRVARELHDGVQSELVSLMLTLKLAEEDRATPSALAATFVALEDHAAAAPASLREIAYRHLPACRWPSLAPPEALRGLAARAPIRVSIAGTAPRSTDRSRGRMYSLLLRSDPGRCKHAGTFAQVKLGLHHSRGVLAVRIEDDGRGFAPAGPPTARG